MPNLRNPYFASSTAPAVNSLLEWMQQNKAYNIKDNTNYSNSNMHSTAGAVERVKEDIEPITIDMLELQVSDGMTP